MKIVLVCDRFDPKGGGLEQWACRLAARLADRSHQVHVLTFRASGVCDDRLSIHVLPWVPSRLDRARSVEAAAGVLEADVVHDTGVGWSFDVLHPQAGSKLANYRRDLSSQSFGERALRRMRPGHWRWLSELRQLERRQYRSADGLVIAVSRMVAGHVRDLHSFPGDRIRLIPNGIDPDRFQPSLLAPLRAEARRRLNLQTEVLFLFAAHNPRLKGIRPLLRAMGALRRASPEVRLAIIGKSPEPEHLRAVERLGIQESVIFAGFVDDTLPFFAAADAFVLPSYYDACSLTILEACAAGLPAITTRYNGASEAMTHGREGYVLEEPENADQLANRMAELTDPALRLRMSAAARTLGLRCSFERNVHEIEGVYFESLERKRRPAWRLTPERSLSRAPADSSDPT